MCSPISFYFMWLPAFSMLNCWNLLIKNSFYFIFLIKFCKEGGIDRGRGLLYSIKGKYTGVHCFCHFKNQYFVHKDQTLRNI